MKLRSAEWLLTVYFAYVAVVSAILPVPLKFSALILALCVPALFATLAHGRHVGFDMARDWLAAGFVIVAYRQMDWFSTLPRNFHLELTWLNWDRTILYHWGLQRGIESLGVLLPAYLELCYALVYAVPPFVVAAMYFGHRRKRVNAVVFLYLLGTLLAYALFPFFPSDPPRVVFGGSDLPNVMTPLRQLNLFLVGNYGIHSSVFPSAHVSSAFSAAWALLAYLPERRRYGIGMLGYAISVAVATVYGRYHYAADAVAGLAVSLVPALMILARSPLRLLRAVLPALP
ncbi:MAG TPA: phosphatase PAP2 family protein [Bryobacteraceae bacterium]|nr:phosphatase PAP2 family protein [Bryobacteraceae bacterium]